MILDEKQSEQSQSCLAARAAARRSLQGGVCTTREPPQPPPPAPWNIPAHKMINSVLAKNSILQVQPGPTASLLSFQKKDSHLLFAPLAPLPLSNLSHVRPSRCFVAHKEPALQIRSSLSPSPTLSCLVNKRSEKAPPSSPTSCSARRRRSAEALHLPSQPSSPYWACH